MKQSDGFVDALYTDRMLSLKKAIYEHKQSSRSWNTILNTVIQNMRFKPCESESCIYSRIMDNLIFIVVYVDDVLIACLYRTDLVSIKENISKKFKLVGNDNVRYILGMEIEREGNTDKISTGPSQYTDSFTRA